MRTGPGYYLTPGIEVRPCQAVLHPVHGRSVAGGYRTGCERIRARRGYNPGAIGGGACTAHLCFNGIRPPGYQSEMLRNLDPDALMGIEVFPSGATAPDRFRSVIDDCGVILVWTR